MRLLKLCFFMLLGWFYCRFWWKVAWQVFYHSPRKWWIMFYQTDFFWTAPVDNLDRYRNSLPLTDRYDRQSENRFWSLDDPT